MIHLLRDRATPEQLDEMLDTLGLYIKLAVDVEQRILVGGGELHADCEKVLLEEGSQQEKIWGASWIPLTQTVLYESIINLRPRQDNRSMDILDSAIQAQVADITRQLLGDV
ncbi:MAG: hypothetical protein KME42_17980 [Tildeniella nuda ZEHNDER 1965/U140]|jgi:hypothetical protein|nr:hypothetical protein [Tildeniella nuda ZEHNDER 1965/U140]